MNEILDTISTHNNEIKCQSRDIHQITSMLSAVKMNVDKLVENTFSLNENTLLTQSEGSKSSKSSSVTVWPSKKDSISISEYIFKVSDNYPSIMRLSNLLNDFEVVVNNTRCYVDLFECFYRRIEQFLIAFIHILQYSTYDMSMETFITDFTSSLEKLKCYVLRFTQINFLINLIDNDDLRMIMSRFDSNMNGILSKSSEVSSNHKINKAKYQLSSVSAELSLSMDKVSVDSISLAVKNTEDRERLSSKIQSNVLIVQREFGFTDLTVYSDTMKATNDDIFPHDAVENYQLRSFWRSNFSNDYHIKSQDFIEALKKEITAIPFHSLPNDFDVETALQNFSEFILSVTSNDRLSVWDINRYSKFIDISDSLLEIVLEINKKDISFVPVLSSLDKSLFIADSQYSQMKALLLEPENDWIIVHGESNSGKSTRLIMALNNLDINSSKIYFDMKNVVNTNDAWILIANQLSLPYFDLSQIVIEFQKILALFARLKSYCVVVFDHVDLQDVKAMEQVFQVIKTQQRMSQTPIKVVCLVSGVNSKRLTTLNDESHSKTDSSNKENRATRSKTDVNKTDINKNDVNKIVDEKLSTLSDLINSVTVVDDNELINSGSGRDLDSTSVNLNASHTNKQVDVVITPKYVNIEELSSEDALKLITRLHVLYPNLLLSASKRWPGSINIFRFFHRSALENKIINEQFDEFEYLANFCTSDSEKVILYCLHYPLLREILFEKDLAWFLCKEYFKDDRNKFLSCFSYLLSIGWLKESNNLVFIHNHSALPETCPRLNEVNTGSISNFKEKQWLKYYEYWTHRIVQINNLLLKPDFNSVSLGRQLYYESSSHIIVYLRNLEQILDKSVNNIDYSSIIDGMQDLLSKLVVNLSKVINLSFEPNSCVLIFKSIYNVLIHDLNNDSYVIATDKHWKNKKHLRVPVLTAIKSIAYYSKKLNLLKQSEKMLKSSIIFLTTADEDLYNESVLILSQVLCELNRHKDALSLCDKLQNQAINLSEINQYQKALDIYQEILTMKLIILGEEDSDTSDTLNNMAIVLKELNRHQEALTLYERSLAVSIKLLGDDDKGTADTYYNMAIVLNDLDRREEAKRCYEKARNCYVTIYGETHEEVLDVDSRIVSLKLT